MMSNFFETIAAPATPLSYGGIGVIRISGDEALNIVSKFFNKKIKENSINHGWIIDNDKKIDEVIVLYFKAPKSYTGEDVIEIQTHGSPVVIKKILNLLLDSGARLADRGEFTKRAFLNRKMDLTEAEAVLDLINSKTTKSASKNASNLSGALYLEISKMRERIIEILSKITASIDFPEDVKEVSYNEIINSLVPIKEKIENILKNAKNHNILREGINISVIGRPNVGKSSLFNALLNLERAIVTDIAGTTRDTIKESFEIKGILATLTDTAGIREDENIDKVEQIGIKQAKNSITESDIVLLLFDGIEGITKDDREIFELAKGKKSILVATKADIQEIKHENAISISSKTGYNIDKLKNLIYEALIDVNIDDSEFTTNQRQQKSLKDALDFINNALFAAQNEELQDLISIDIKSALVSLGEISGEVINDEILNGIFEKFCIGK
ncbi:TPA: tRNA uridine-5-carboxymethylaminomethyl(34) synthesis GTPase MnmE [Candidatus Galligastranaerophilus gallistercoris]|nr:tRNA uridine-5-carboxymethylaminomethyl(34) synthesis GTPase MnmE [Candidatus Galligastranaerophilus gallistercoris]